jgi:threonine dehydratase
MIPLIERIRDAHTAIRPFVMTSPLERSDLLSKAIGCEVFLKCDHLQPTGSFKLRGAINNARLHTSNTIEVITASTGNHGRALAYAANMFGLGTTVCCPSAPMAQI